MTDLEKFKKFFDDMGIKYEVNGDCLYMDAFETRGGQLIVVDFYEDGKFQCFSPYPYDYSRDMESKSQKGIIDKHNTERIRGDAYIACDALQSLINAPTLHKDYIGEKLDRVRSCINFISLFENKGD